MSLQNKARALKVLHMDRSKLRSEQVTCSPNLKFLACIISFFGKKGIPSCFADPNLLADWKWWQVWANQNIQLSTGTWSSCWNHTPFNSWCYGSAEPGPTHWRPTTPRRDRCNCFICHITINEFLHNEETYRPYLTLNWWRQEEHHELFVHCFLFGVWSIVVTLNFEWQYVTMRLTLIFSSSH
jgi:hypothetical protein